MDPKGLYCFLLVFFNQLSESDISANNEHDEDALVRAVRSDNRGDRYQATTSLGKLKSAKGLRAILEHPESKSILRIYVSAYPSKEPLQPEIETLIARHIGHKDLQNQLAAFVRFRKYQSLDLFEAFLNQLNILDHELRINPDREMRFPKPPLEGLVLAIAATRTDRPGTDQILLGVASDYSKSIALAITLGLLEKGYVPALKMVKALSKDVRLDRKTYERLILLAVEMKCTECAERLLEELDYLIESSPGGIQDFAARSIAVLSEYPPDVSVDFDRLKKIVLEIADSSTPSYELAKSYVAFLERHEDQILEREPFEQLTLDIRPLVVASFAKLLSFDSVEIWKRTREIWSEQHQKGAIKEDLYTWGQRELQKRFEKKEPNACPAA